MKRVCIPFRHADRVRPYVAAVNAAGAEAVAVSVTEFPALQDFDGLLLTGGTDINPKLYGQTANEHVDVPDQERDLVEWRLISEAIQMDLPLLAICRGMQLLNAHAGGTLLQHLGSERHDTEFTDKSTVAHEVSVEPGSLLAQVVETLSLPVNSRHHQAVDQVGQGLAISARDGDIIEAIEHPDRRFLLAVQWHPEDQAPSCLQQQRIFQRFAQSLARETK